MIKIKIDNCSEFLEILEVEQRNELLKNVSSFSGIKKALQEIIKDEYSDLSIGDQLNMQICDNWDKCWNFEVTYVLHIGKNYKIHLEYVGTLK